MPWIFPHFYGEHRLFVLLGIVLVHYLAARLVWRKRNRPVAVVLNLYIGFLVLLLQVADLGCDWARMPEEVASRGYEDQHEDHVQRPMINMTFNDSEVGSVNMTVGLGKAGSEENFDKNPGGDQPTRSSWTVAPFPLDAGVLIPHHRGSSGEEHPRTSDRDPRSSGRGSRSEVRGVNSTFSSSDSGVDFVTDQALRKNPPARASSSWSRGQQKRRPMLKPGGRGPTDDDDDDDDGPGFTPNRPKPFAFWANTLGIGKYSILRRIPFCQALGNFLFLVREAKRRRFSLERMPKYLHWRLVLSGLGYFFGSFFVLPNSLFFNYTEDRPNMDLVGVFTKRTDEETIPCTDVIFFCC